VLEVSAPDGQRRGRAEKSARFRHKSEKRMKAGLRLGWEYAAAAALMLSPAAALAQDAGQSATQNAAEPANTAIGPRALENFNLQGTVTKPAPTAPAPAPQSAPATTAAPPRATSERTPAASEPPAPQQTAPEPAERAPDVADKAPPQPLPSAPSATTPTPAAPGLADAARAPDVTAAPAPASGAGHLSLLPWILAALLLAGGALFLFWRNRSRLNFAGASAFEGYDQAPVPTPQPTPKPMPRAAVAPSAPNPAPAPMPRAAASPSPPQPIPAPAPVAPSPLAGIVSTRLRPWIELSLEPISCVVEDEKITIEFELELFPRGNAPARAVLVEAQLVNAGREQDQQLSAFFANPVGQGQRIVSIEPLKRVVFRSAIAADREHLQIYNVEGRKVFVPLLAFNVLYRWSSGEGQSSLSYLIGRDTKGDKMAPFRADLGVRTFEGLGKQLLPVGLRQ
jgi:hypothetical protein